MSKALKRVEVLLSHWGGNKTVIVSVADLREVARLARERDRIYEDLALYNRAFMRWLADGKPLGNAPARRKRPKR